MTERKRCTVWLQPDTKEISGKVRVWVHMKAEDPIPFTGRTIKQAARRARRWVIQVLGYKPDFVM